MDGVSAEGIDVAAAAVKKEICEKETEMQFSVRRGSHHPLLEGEGVDVPCKSHPQGLINAHAAVVKGIRYALHSLASAGSDSESPFSWE